MKQKRRNIPRRKWTMDFGDNLIPFWITMVVLVLLLIGCWVYGISWDIFDAAFGILLLADAIYYFIKWIRKIDF